jgi:hypothetical protein
VTPEKLVEGGDKNNEIPAQNGGKKKRRKRFRKLEGENAGNASSGLNEARGGQWGGIAY